MNISRITFRRLLVLISFSILFYVCVQNIGSVVDFLRKVIIIVRPVALGLILAFILNVPMKAAEKYLFEKPLCLHDTTKPRLMKLAAVLKRPLCLLLALCLVFAMMAVVALFVIPVVAETISELISGIPAFAKRLEFKVNELATNNPRIVETLETLQIDWRELTEQAVGLMRTQAAGLLKHILSAGSDLVSGLTTFLVALVLAIYILSSKENLQRQMLKLLRALASDKRYDSILSVFKLANATFSAYVSGQFLEACLLGLATYIGMTILKLPFSGLIGVVVTIFAMIPIVGSFISVAVGTLLTVIEDPGKALIFFIFFIVLQQIEGNFIYPHVVGKSVKLSGLWVLVAISIGGSLGGIAGILVSIPTFSVLYSLIGQWVNRCLLRKEMNGLPMRWFDRTMNFFADVSQEMDKPITDGVGTKQNNIATTSNDTGVKNHAATTQDDRGKDGTSLSVTSNTGTNSTKSKNK